MRQSLRRSGAALQRVSTALLLISLAGALSVGRAEIVRAPQASRTTVTPRKDPTQPAFAFNLQAGPHLDFRLTYGPDQERIDREVRRLAASSRNDEILEAAVVANPLRRPMLYADIDDLDQEETVPDDWFNDVNNQRGTIARSLRSVGRIEVEHLVSDPSVVCVARGTGFVVADGIVMTNRHVAETFAEGNEFHQPNGRPVAAYINFSGTRADRDALRFRLKQVLYIAPNEKGVPDVALFRAETGPGNRFPRRLRLQFNPPPAIGEYRAAFVCGYPAVFEDLDSVDLMQVRGVKRVSPGEFLVRRRSHAPESESDTLVYHNCTTAKGNSGSPVVDFATGKVWGLHFGRNRFNGAEPLWNLLQIDEIQQIPEIQQAIEADSLFATEAHSHAVAPAHAPSPESAVADDSSEAIPRPAWFAGLRGISTSSRFPEEWFTQGSAEHRNIDRALPSVGLAKVTEGDQSFQFSAVALGDGEVLCPFSSVVAGAAETEPKLSVEFDRVIGVETPTALSGTFSRRVELADGELMTVFRLAESPTRPPSLPIASQEEMNVLEVGDKVVLVAFALESPRQDEITRTVFALPLGVKRISPGEITAVDERQIGHDCSSTAGGAGGALISLKTGSLIGLHMGGSREGNFALHANALRRAIAR